MRHMGRTHGVGVASIHEHIVTGRVILGYIPTTLMAADIFTKFYPQDKREIWRSMVKLVGVYEWDSWKEDFGKPVEVISLPWNDKRVLTG